MFNKKALGPVVALSLLLVVAVTSAVTFQIWFQGYSGSIYTTAEQRGSVGELNQEINAVINNNVYLKNSNKENLTIKKVEIGGKTCTINQNSSSSIVKLDISSCTQNLTQDRYEVVIHTNKRIFQKDFFYNPSSGSTGSSTTDSTTCATILNTGGSHGSGTYAIDPDGTGGNAPFNITCDMDNGGRTILNLDYKSYSLYGSSNCGGPSDNDCQETSVEPNLKSKDSISFTYLDANNNTIPNQQLTALVNESSQKFWTNGYVSIYDSSDWNDNYEFQFTYIDSTTSKNYEIGQNSGADCITSTNSWTEVTRCIGKSFNSTQNTKIPTTLTITNTANVGMWLNFENTNFSLK